MKCTKCGRKELFEAAFKCNDDEQIYQKVPMPEPTCVFDEHEYEKTESSVAEARTRTDVCKGAIVFEGRDKISSRTLWFRKKFQAKQKSIMWKIFTQNFGEK